MKSWIGLGLVSFALVGCIFEAESTDVKTETAISDSVENKLSPTEQRKERVSKMPLLWNSSAYLGKVKEVKIEMLKCDDSMEASVCNTNGEPSEVTIESYSELGALLKSETRIINTGEIGNGVDLAWDGGKPMKYHVYGYYGDETTNWESTIKHVRFSCVYEWVGDFDGACILSLWQQEEYFYGNVKNYFTESILDSAVFKNDDNKMIEYYDEYGVFEGFSYANGDQGSKRRIKYDSLARVSEIQTFNCSSGECKDSLKLVLGSYDSMGNLNFISGRGSWHPDSNYVSRYTYTYWE